MNYLTKSKVIAYLIVIFIAGGATGAVITLKGARERDVEAPSLEKTCNRLQDRLVSKLGLTEDQVAKLQPVFDETAEALRKVHFKALCDTDHILRRAHERIAKELTPEQQAKLAEFDEKRTEWLKRRDIDPLAEEVKFEGRKGDGRNLKDFRKSKENAPPKE